MSYRSPRSILAVAAISMLATAGVAPVAMARHGADDPPGHNAGDDHGGKRVVRVASRGADDPPGDDRGGRRHGLDDGPSHA